MKANHNRLMSVQAGPHGVINLSISKNESKSQLATNPSIRKVGVINLSISKNESKSQPAEGSSDKLSGCYKSQYFKE